MPNRSKTKLITLLSAAALAGAFAADAQAAGFAVHGWRGTAVGGHNSNGRGVVATNRYGGTYASGARLTGNGGYQAGRSVQGANGHGYTTSRSGNCGGGSCNGSSTTTFNNGKTIDRSYSGSHQSGGGVDYSASRTGVNGSSASVSGSYAPPQ